MTIDDFQQSIHNISRYNMYKINKVKRISHTLMLPIGI